MAQGALGARIAGILADTTAGGATAIDDPLLAAADLSALWSSFIPKELEFGITPPLGGALVDERVCRGTRLFLRAVGRN